MTALRNRVGHYILPCGFFFYLSVFFFFSSPNLICRWLDVYHTSTHGVALVWIQNAALKCAASGSLERQDSQKSTKFTVCAPSHNFVGLCLRNWHILTIGKKVVKQQCLPHMSSQYGELRHTSGWDLLASLGHPTHFTGFRVLAALLHCTLRLVVSVSQTLRRWT